TVRKHIAHAHDENMPPSMYEYFRGAAPNQGRADRELQEFVMQVWIGFRQNGEYVHEWTGEVAQEQDVGAAIGNAINNFPAALGRPAVLSDGPGTCHMPPVCAGPSPHLSRRPTCVECDSAVAKAPQRQRGQAG